MADINTVRVMNMPIAVDISTPALAMAKRRTMVYPIIRRNIPIALHDDSTSVRNAMKPGAQSQGVGLNRLVRCTIRGVSTVRRSIDDLSPNVLDNCEHSTKRFGLHLHETGRCTALMLQQESFDELKSKGIAQPSWEVRCTEEPRVVAIILATPVACRHCDMASNVRHIEALPWFR